MPEQGGLATTQEACHEQGFDGFVFLFGHDLRLRRPRQRTASLGLVCLQGVHGSGFFHIGRAFCQPVW
ncbi:MAG: hypothetical protein DRH20_06130 [Deltaproteobacteria bacterium]|nr:MAG: hypothetical protein DRH20_06130 [Deltaproteobacteria bacterium]